MRVTKAQIHKWDRKINRDEELNIDIMEGTDYTLEEQLRDLNHQQEELIETLDEIWCYHPDNIDFIDPLKTYNEIVKKLNILEGKIGTLEFKINSKN